jgi:hypothetical protein
MARISVIQILGVDRIHKIHYNYHGRYYMVCPKCRAEVRALLSSKIDPKGACVECVIKLKSKAA